MTDFTSELTIRRIISPEFIIKTKAIRQLEEQILTWLTLATCGAIIYGRARLGKTRAMMSVANTIKEKYGDDFPVISWDVTDHAVTEKNFYTSLLMAMGFSKVPRISTALELKERVLNVLSMNAYNTPFRKVVILIDEAWKLSEKDFYWLMDLYNNLNRKDILLSCFLFGTRELKDIKSRFKEEGKDQIIGRFMINEFQFYGMKQIEEMTLCLMELDRVKIVDLDTENDMLLIDYYFPNRENATFRSICKDFWTAFETIKENRNIVVRDIPMKYFIDTFIIMLQNYGSFSANSVAFPTVKEITKCVKESGYGDSDDEYIKAK